MTPDERLERIENAMFGVVEVQRLQAGNIAQLMETLGQYADAADQRMKRVEESLVKYIESSDVQMRRIEENLAKYIDSSEVRMRRMEENLDGLIRAITAEHTNGKTS
jgi:hypothetical protein